jgi:hypothetical protein
VVFYAYALFKMLVYRLADLVVGRYIPVTSIGKQAIFIKHRSISASAKAFPNLKGDTIIFSHYFGNEPYISEYHLSNDARGRQPWIIAAWMALSRVHAASFTT